MLSLVLTVISSISFQKLLILVFTVVRFLSWIESLADKVLLSFLLTLP
jgi:hypothetical protein